MRRLLPMLAFLALPAVAAALAVPAPVTAAQACASTSAATYRHSFDGADGLLTVTAVTPLCAGQTQSFTLTSYLSSDSGRFLYDKSRGSITRTNRSLTLTVTVPPCTALVAAVSGRAAPTEITGDTSPFGSDLLGAAGSRSAGPAAWHAGGTGECAPDARVIFTNACDGTFTAELLNPPTAHASAVFLNGTRLIRVSPGRSTVLKAAAGSTMTIRASTFTTYVGTWRPPDTPCTTDPAASPAPPGAPAPLVPTAASASAPSSEPTASISTEAAATPDALFTTPAATATTDVAANEEGGMGAGSFLAIVLGLLMIGAGGAALTWLIREMRKPA